jgi:hypothetical protein
MDMKISKLDTEVYRKLDAAITIHDVTVSDAVNDVMLMYLKKKNNRRNRL